MSEHPSRSSHSSRQHRDRSSERVSEGHRSKHRHRDREETEEERKERKRAKRDKEDRKGVDGDRDRKKDKRERREDQGLEVVDDDEGMWVEKGVEEVSTPVVGYQGQGIGCCAVGKRLGLRCIRWGNPGYPSLYDLPQNSPGYAPRSILQASSCFILIYSPLQPLSPAQTPCPSAQIRLNRTLLFSQISAQRPTPPNAILG